MSKASNLRDFTLDVSSVMRTEAPASTRYCVYSDEPCRIAAEKMARKGVVELAVRERATKEIFGSVDLQDLLQGRKLAFDREENRSRVLVLRKRKGKAVDERALSDQATQLAE